MQTFPPSTAPAPPVRPQAVQARDWLRTLWPASYKGVPFKVQWDEEEGSRRIVEHQFPMRDDPFLEDLGEGVRHYRCDAYVASDSADGDAASVVAVCAMRGAGTLVLPAHGPIIVRCLTFKRNREKDKHGYIALELRFAREGAASALVSVASLANLIFVASEQLAAATAASFATNFQASGAGALAPPVDYVVTAATDGLQTAASALEAVRTTEAVDPLVSAAQRDAIQNAFDQVPELLADPTTAATAPALIVASAVALSDGLAPAAAVRAFSDIIAEPSFSVVVQSSYPSANLRSAAINEAAAMRTLRLAALAAYCEAVARIPLTDRPMALTLRANVAEYFEAEVIDLPASEIDLVHAINVMRDAVIKYLSRSVLDLAPVIALEANLSMPSLFWAWRLYQDPNRSTELVARNLVQHPSFMPPAFEALAI